MSQFNVFDGVPRPSWRSSPITARVGVALKERVRARDPFLRAPCNLEEVTVITATNALSAAGRSGVVTALTQRYLERATSGMG